MISTVHQLFRFKQHFDTIFIDEVDAFPLSMDPQLTIAIQTASKSIYSHIYMTATPPRHLLQQMSSNQVIKLPARFHRHPLPVPQFKYFKLNQSRATAIIKYFSETNGSTTVYVSILIILKRCTRPILNIEH